MAGELDVEAMVERFRARARAVRNRPLPPVEGAERKRFVDQMRIDFQDYAMIGDAVGRIDGGILTLTVDLRPGASPGAAGGEAGTAATRAPVVGPRGVVDPRASDS
ncbi:MAG: hypothetical protein M0T80_12200 [Actinomycetota bacterium]|nr:hypothetical protein [Actinomycetota bacterium]